MPVVHTNCSVCGGDILVEVDSLVGHSSVELYCQGCTPHRELYIDDNILNFPGDLTIFSDELERPLFEDISSDYYDPFSGEEVNDEVDDE